MHARSAGRDQGFLARRRACGTHVPLAALLAIHAAATSAKPLWVRLPPGNVPHGAHIHMPLAHRRSHMPMHLCMRTARVRARAHMGIHASTVRRGAPEQWWRAPSAPQFMEHNILHETESYDPSFRSAPAADPGQMWYLRIPIDVATTRRDVPNSC